MKKKMAPQEKAHAVFGASVSDRWLNCPGSIGLCEKAPPQVETEYAAEGTEAHTVLEIVLKNFKKPKEIRKFLEKKYPKEMIDHAFHARDEIEKRMTPGALLLSETRVDASPFTKPGQFGTTDAAIVEHFGTLHVIDYKYGMGIPVDPENNTQMIYYGLGIAHMFDYNFQDVVLTIIQPRAPHEKGAVRDWKISMDELMSWREKFVEGVKACEDPLAPLKYGEKWCRFCPAKSICPEISNQALKQAQIDFSVDEPKAVTSLPKVGDGLRKNLPSILEAADKLEIWIESVREYAFQALQRGEKVKGFKLVEKRTIRKWTDSNKVERLARKNFGDEAFDISLKSPAQLEEIVGKDWVNRYVTNKSSGLTMARSSDPRKEVNTIEADFTVVKETSKKGKKK